jgi:hypothetical protein
VALLRVLGGVHNLSMFSDREHVPKVNELPYPLGDAVAAIKEHGLDVYASASLPTIADVVLTLRFGAEEETFRVEVKTKPSTATVALLARSQGDPGELPPLLVSPHLSDYLLEACRQLAVNCVDAAGNVYLRFGHVLLDVRGRRTVTRQPTSPTLRAFRTAGVKVIFVLLSTPDLVNAAMRDIAAASRTSLGSVQAVLSDLEVQGYLETFRTGGRRLHLGRQLFDRWVGAYGLNLHPKLHLGSYGSADSTWWRSADAAVRQAGCQWGGETAAWHLDGYLKPARGILYADAIPNGLLAMYRMRRTTEDGSLWVRRRFWRLPDDALTLTTPTTLVYADLVATADPRQVEAAQGLRAQDDLLRRIDRS